MALTPRSPADWLAPEAIAGDQAFWREWLRQAGPALGATCAMIVQPPRNGNSARVMLRTGEQTRELPTDLIDRLSLVEPLQTETGASGGGSFALRLPWDEAVEAPLVAVGEVSAVAWSGSERDGPGAAWRDRVLLWGTAAGRRRRTRELDTTRRSADELAAALELAALVRGQKTFQAAALETCNQLANRHGADRVALGWWREPYVRIAAISQMNQVEQRMAAVGEIEAAMEEAVEQDATLVWPENREPNDSAAAGEVVAQHGALARAQGWKFLCTIPLRNAGQMVGAVTWHRQERAFTPAEAEGFALVLPALAPLLAEAERKQGGWWRRLRRSAEEAMQRHWNLRHPWSKLAALTAAAVLAGSLIIHVPYRVEADFAVRPEQQMVFSAPFDGFVESVVASPGDFIETGDALFSLDATALRLQEGELLADMSRYARERERAEAERDLAGMRVAAAQRDQVAAQLARLRRQIEQTTAVAPFNGFVLDDGDLRERLGAPVRQGDSLLRFAKLDGLYFELLVPEADAPLIEVNGRVELAFRGRPDEIVTAAVTRIEPEAVVQEAGAMFVVRAGVADAPADWWRPGMTGIGKLVTPRRSLFDIFTRRLRDWLHLQLWW